MIRDDEQSSDGPSPEQSDDQSDELDDRFLSLLAEFDEAVAGGMPPPPLVDTDLSAEQVQRLKAIQDCLVLLAGEQRARNASASSPAGTPDSLEGVATSAGTPSDTPDSTRSKAVPSNVRFGRFQLVRRLGHGGTGVVYLATDPKLNRQVAIKVPLPYCLCSDDLHRRFLREAEAAARLSHPNIVTVYEVSEFGPFSYIASEYCSGPNLASFLDSRSTPISTKAAAELVAILADAMQHAHLRGVLHRDIKPSNVFLVDTAPNAEITSGGSDDISRYTPKIGDFGLAKLREEVIGETWTGAVVGTLLYMSPEQAEGRVNDISVQTDVYALGAVLYVILTGKPPHRGATDAETLQKIVSADPIPPRLIRADISSDLSAICMKCLERDPLQRYASAAAVGKDLQRFLDDRPTLARERGPLPLAIRWVWRNPVYAALLLVSVGALLTGIGGTLVYNMRLRAAVDRAQVASNESRQLLYSSDIRLAQDAWKATEFQESIRLLSRQIPPVGTPDLREFAWHYLWKQCHSELHTLLGHSGAVYYVAFSLDGKSLLSAGKDGTIRLWDVETGKLVRTFAGHDGEVNTVAMASRDSAASASDDGTVRIWDTQTGQQVMCLDAQEGPVFGLAASGNGNWLASGGEGGNVHLFDLRTGDQVWTGKSRTPVESLSFSPNNQDIVSGHFDGTIRWWNRKSGELIHTEQTPAGSATSAVYSPIFSRVASGGRTGYLATYRHTEQGWETVAAASLEEQAIGIHGLAFSPRDNCLAVGRRDGVIGLWNAGRTLSEFRTLPGHKSRIWSVAWSPDGRLLASAAADGSIKLWSPARSRYWCNTYPRIASPICSVAVSLNQKSMITGTRDGHLCEWDRTARQVRKISAQPEQGTVIATYLEDENSAIAAGPGTLLQRWDLTSGDLTPLPQLPEVACSLAISGDRTLVAVGCQHSTAVLLDAQTGQLQHRLTTMSLDVEHVALTPDGKWLATTGVSEKIELWNTQSGQRHRILPGHAYRTLCLTFSPDSSVLASGGSDQNVRLWDVATGRLLATLVGHGAPITALAISPDGRNLASGSYQTASVQLWDLVTRQPLVKSGEYQDTVAAITFTDDGRTLIVGSAGGQLLEFSLDNDDDFAVSQPPSSPIALRSEMFGQTSPKSSPGGPSGIELMAAAHNYAQRNGFSTGYPTFHRGQSGENATLQVVLLNGSKSQTIRMSLDEFCEAVSFRPSTSLDRASLFIRLLQVTHSWFDEKGFKGALPTFLAETGPGQPEFEITLLLSTHYKRRKIGISELGNLEDVESIFRQVHLWAVKSGFLSGFPTYQQQDGQLVCVTMDRDQGEIREIAIDELIIDRRPESSP